MLSNFFFPPSVLPPLSTPSTPPLNLYRRRTRFTGMGLPALYQRRRCSHFGGVAIFTRQVTRVHAYVVNPSTRSVGQKAGYLRLVVAFGLINREATPTFCGPFHPPASALSVVRRGISTTWLHRSFSFLTLSIIDPPKFSNRPRVKIIKNCLILLSNQITFSSLWRRCHRSESRQQRERQLATRLAE